MSRKVIGSQVITTPFLRITTSAGASLDPEFTDGGNAAYEWISPDGSVSTGSTPNPGLDQAGLYTVKCSDWTDVTRFSCAEDTVTGVENLQVVASTLERVYCNGNPGLTSINVSGLPVLTHLIAQDCGLTEICCTNSNAITAISLNGNVLTGIDVEHMTSLTALNLQDNAIASYFSIALLTSLATFRVYNNGMPQAVVDALLADLVTAGGENGLANLGGTNAAPSAAGLADVAILEGRGWDVTITA